MLYRVAVTFIWLFWIVMVTLLIRSEYFAEQASLYRLPVSYVGKKIFASDTGSDLAIYYKQTLVGRLLIDPSPPGERMLKGSVKLAWPVLGQPYHGEAYYMFLFNPMLNVELFNLTSKSESGSLVVEGNRLKDRIDANLRIQSMTLDRHFKWSELEKTNYEDMMTSLGQQPGLQQLPSALVAGTARQIRWYAANASLKRNDEKVDALLIATEGNRDYWIKIWVTLSGEVLLVQASPAIGIVLENKALMEIES